MKYCVCLQVITKSVIRYLWMIEIISVILLKITLRLCCFLNLISLIDIGDNLNIKTYNLLHLQQISKSILSILLHTTLRVFKLISSHAIRHMYNVAINYKNQYVGQCNNSHCNLRNIP